MTWSQVVGITRDVLTGLTFIEASSRGVSRGVRVSIGLANVWMFSRDVAKVRYCAECTSAVNITIRGADPYI